MRFRLYLLLTFISHTILPAQEETALSGVINEYGRVLTIDECSNALELDDASGFEVDMQVILIQMKGAAINMDNDDDFGSVIDPGGAGWYEKNKITAINANQVVLEKAFLHDYDPQYAVQLVSMPVYENAITADTVMARPWDGQTGGIVAMEVLGELKIDAPIFVVGQGFRGGEATPVTDNDCFVLTNANNFAYAEGEWRASPKGESIADFIPGKEWGKGAQASGGGGGNDHNAGGGGGGHLTTGGIGGRNQAPAAFDCPGDHPGLGGKPLLNEEERIYFGGGGGAGHANNDNTLAGKGGGNGGGIVMIKAHKITRVFAGIYADGESPGTGEGDGAGGGGAGGAIMLVADTLSQDILVHAFGGNGGVIDNNNSDRCFGPGGGGSGGRILVNLTQDMPLSTFQVLGGQAGRSTNSAECETGANGAQGGENGLAATFAGFRESEVVFQGGAPEITDQTEVALVCEGNPVILEVQVAGGAPNFRWQIDQGSGYVDLDNDANFSGVRTSFLSITDATADILDASFRLSIDDGCGNELFSDPITITPGEVPDVNFNLVVDQLRLEVLTVIPDDADSYLWDFGDGNTSNIPAPEHIYAQGGEYEVKLVVGNACGRDSLSRTIEVSGLAPAVDFSYTDTTGCGPVTVSYFNESSPDAVSFQWTFIGGTPATSMEENPMVTYDAPGEYQVRLIATNEGGGADTLVQTVNVVFLPAPTADFVFTANGLTVNFDNLSQNADNAFWDFGDGATSMEEEPVHEFPSAGSYDVQLIVGNGCGNDTLTVGIDVSAAPFANFAIEKIEGCSPVVVTFQNQSTGDIERYAWSFQGGEPEFSTEENPVVTYNSSGTFEVVLQVSNESGNNTSIQNIEVNISDPPAAGFTFTANNLMLDIQDNAQNADSLCWLIEQDTGLIERLEGPLSTYLFPAPGAYQLSQIAKNSCGADTLTQTINVNLRPIASFEFDTDSGCTPLTINTQNNAQFATQYEWIFEGGQPATSTEADPSVTYTQSGTYEWMLIAINEAGRDTLTETVIVDVLQKPAADFAAQPFGVLSLGLTSRSVDADSICWLIDGQVIPAIAQDSLLDYTFSAPGTYEYGLVAKNECGMDTLMSQITLDGIPEASFEVSEASGCVPVIVEVSSPYFSPPLLQNLVDFSVTTTDEGDVELDQQNGLVVIETTSARLRLQLIVGSEFGRDTLTREVTLEVDPLPVADFDFATNGQTLSFTDLSAEENEVFWDFGDGTTSTRQNPAHTYAELGDYAVMLIATNDCGSDTLIQNVFVNIPPVADFEVETVGNCAPLQIRLTDLSTGLNNEINYEFSGPAVVPVDEETGLYEVSEGGELTIILSVENELGSDMSTQTLVLEGAPMAGFASRQNGLTASFEDQSVNAVQVNWDFGDNTTSQERSPMHTYDSEGQYTVLMIVSNTCGSDTLSRTITIGEVLEAKFIALNSFGCAPHLVQFRNRSTGNISSVEWEFPGGTPRASNEMEPQVLYANPGTYPVTLTVNGPLGTNATTINEMIRIVEFPEADFSYEVNGFRVTFTNLSENAEAYRWNFGDGNESTMENPVHTYSSGGVFSVTLNATIATCGSSVTMNIPVMLSDAEDVFAAPELNVYPNPVRDFLFVESPEPAVFPLKIDLISLQGQLLLRRELGQPGQLDLSSFAAGAYYLRFENEERQWIGKLLIMP